MSPLARPSRAAIVLLGACLCRCSGAPDPSFETPETVALGALELAARRPLEETRVDLLFAVAASGAERVSLLEALDTLTATGEAELIALAREQGDGEAYADLAIDGAGGRRALYRMKLVLGPERWRVVWLAGPGIEWPARAKRTGSALSVSSHARGTGER